MKNPGMPGFSFVARHSNQLVFFAGALFAGALFTAGRAAGRDAVFAGDTVFFTAALDLGECGRALPWLPR